MGLLSLAFAAFARFILPVRVKAAWWRARRVGSTQSNISTPRQMPLIRSSGDPTPIKYQGLICGENLVDYLDHRVHFCFGFTYR